MKHGLTSRDPYGNKVLHALYKKYVDDFSRNPKGELMDFEEFATAHEEYEAEHSIDLIEDDIPCVMEQWK